MCLEYRISVGRYPWENKLIVEIVTSESARCRLEEKKPTTDTEK